MNTNDSDKEENQQECNTKEILKNYMAKDVHAYN